MNVARKFTIVFMGDFNIHWDDQQDPDAVSLREILEMFDMTNYVTFPTHI